MTKSRGSLDCYGFLLSEYQTKHRDEKQREGKWEERLWSILMCVFQAYSLIHTVKRWSHKSKATHVIRSKAFPRVHRQIKWQTPAPYQLISSLQNSGSFLSIRTRLISFAALCCFSLWTTETCLWPSLFPCPSWLWSIFSPTWPTTPSSPFLQS